MLYIIIIILVFLNALIYKKNKYYAGFFFSVALTYDFSTIIAFSNEEKYYLLLDRLAPYVTKDTITIATLFELIFFTCVFLGASVNNKITYFKFTNKKFKLPDIYYLYVASLMILIFGVISRLKGGGESRIEQYVSGFTQVSITPFHFYGATILPLVSFFCIRSVYQKKYTAVLLLVIAATPTLYDLFLAGRRQMFAPIIFIIFYFIFSDKTISNRKKIFTSSLMLFISVIGFAVQFSLRYSAMGAQSGDVVGYTSYLGDIFAPQVGEFVAVGATSLSAYRDFIYLDIPTLGFDSFVVFLCQSLPIVGSFFKTTLQTDALNNFSFSSIAPFGALSLQAEGIVFFGYFGIIIYGFIFGFIISFLDRIIKISSCNSFTLNFKEIIFICLASILIFKYRSGLIDMISTTFIFIIFSFLVYIFSFFMFRINYSIKQQIKSTKKNNTLFK